MNRCSDCGQLLSAGGHRHTCPTVANPAAAKEIAEILRLRAGIQMIVDGTVCPDVFPEWDAYDEAQQLHLSAVLIARATLEGGEYPTPELSVIAERLASAECVIRQLSRDTFGEELSVQEFADRAGYDS